MLLALGGFLMYKWKQIKAEESQEESGLEGHPSYGNIGKSIDKSNLVETDGQD
jgi:hypothetical protein